MTVWWSRTILYGALVAAALLPIGALGSRLGLWPFTIGFLAMAVGLVLAIVGIATGVAGLLIARKRALSGDQPPIVAGLVISLLIVGFLGNQFLTATSGPTTAIHNISTDTDDPPQFIDVVALRGEDSNPLELDAAKIAPVQKEFYPWVEPLTIRSSTSDAFQKSLRVLEDMGLEIVATHPDIGLIEATDTTFWFGFKDDVAIRVQEYPQGVIIDVRSVSRVGQSDLGVNARRIGEILNNISGS